MTLAISIKRKGVREQRTARLYSELDLYPVIARNIFSWISTEWIGRNIKQLQWYIQIKRMILMLMVNAVNIIIGKIQVEYHPSTCQTS